MRKELQRITSRRHDLEAKHKEREREPHDIRRRNDIALQEAHARNQELEQREAQALRLQIEELKQKIETERSQFILKKCKKRGESNNSRSDRLAAARNELQQREDELATKYKEIKVIVAENCTLIHKFKQDLYEAEASQRMRDNEVPKQKGSDTAMQTLRTTLPFDSRHFLPMLFLLPLLFLLPILMPTLSLICLVTYFIGMTPS